MVGYNPHAGDILEVVIPQVTGPGIPNNLPNGINVGAGTSQVVSQEDPANINDGNQPTHSIDLLLSAVASAPAGITPIEVIVRQQGLPDIDLFLNILVQSSAPNRPIATTVNASSVTSTTATLNASVNPEGSATSVTFVYGTDSDPDDRHDHDHRAVDRRRDERRGRDRAPAGADAQHDLLLPRWWRRTRRARPTARS